MRVDGKRLWRIASVAALLAVGLALAAQVWLGASGLKAQVEARASVALGVSVTIGGLGLSLLPTPGVSASGVVLGTRKPLVLGEVVVRPAWLALLGGRLALDTLTVRDALISQSAVEQLREAVERASRAAPSPRAADGDATPPPPLPRHVALRGLQWQAQAGWSSTIDVDAWLDGMLPRELSLNVTEGRWAGARAALLPADGQWRVNVDIGGGRMEGPLRLGRSGRALQLSGELKTAGVQVAALTAPQRLLSGRLEALTTLSAQVDATQPQALPDALRTQTRFTVRQAVLHGLDLGRAVRTVGVSRGGQTDFDTITGQVTTRGRAVSLRDVHAGSALLSAKADVDISADQRLSGRVAVDVAGGVAGVPLALAGTLDSPEISLTRGGLIGAAVGTAVMPGVGTGLGARLGDRIGNLFGR